ncbi:Putative component of 'biosynthetic module' [Acetitomaculum ruminis DSM 5522]|uniref:Putative component of 'biosynthetic module n=1 Tax=Acetitomaculum ruminis DSM 5522 TaxID=1120918 RepID=A0A1I0YC20_9FIRM|nr:YceG family protein [Acetitomaculum ruminis]SFB10732.1 Putative component of 'biosynthetic module' [Acetitomaculum ruminis DSM 5522]
MYKRTLLNNLDDIFLPLGQRVGKGIFFIRIENTNDKILEFLGKYLDKAAKCGVVLEPGLPNPDNNQLSYYNEIMGGDFEMNPIFLDNSLKKWLPRLTPASRNIVAKSMYNTLSNMQKSGKNENILKNAYIKFMCWLYYKLERIVKDLGNEDLPKLLYIGTASNYELKMLEIMADAGCDIAMVLKDGGVSYKKADSTGNIAQNINVDNPKAFDGDFSVKTLSKALAEKKAVSFAYDESLVKIPATNTWISGEFIKDSLIAPDKRGDREDAFYNLFIRVYGVNDKASYASDLFKWKSDLKNRGRQILILENTIPIPNQTEINAIPRKDYSSVALMIADLLTQIKAPADKGLENQVKKAFSDVLTEESKKEGENLNRLKNKAIYIISWYKRYYNSLFSNYKPGDMSVFIYLGICHNHFEELFLKFLSRIYVDVVILLPDLSLKDELSDERLFEKKYEYSLELTKFPVKANDIKYGTAAFHAERELNETLYTSDSGLYRNRQYKSATAITLETILEEINILWEEELTFRPNFEVVNDNVIMPTIAALVYGVKDGNVSEYWSGISKLVTEDTYFLNKVPLFSKGPLNNAYQNAVQNKKMTASEVTKFYINKKIDRRALKAHNSYQYGIFREETQDFILDKIEQLIDSQLIAGTFQNGTEYTIISLGLSLDKELMRMLQNFDFTKKSPKIVALCTSEQVCTLEDSIILALAHYLGFDIVIFVPTGYQVIGKFFNKPLFMEHQTGEYVYDLVAPDFRPNSKQHRGSFIDKIFKRGR